MAEIKHYDSAADCLVSAGVDSHHANELYKYVNDLKLSKDYISKLQHEENEILMYRLSGISPFGNIFN